MHTISLYCVAVTLFFKKVQSDGGRQQIAAIPCWVPWRDVSTAAFYTSFAHAWMVWYCRAEPVNTPRLMEQSLLSRPAEN